MAKPFAFRHTLYKCMYDKYKVELCLWPPTARGYRLQSNVSAVLEQKSANTM